MERKMPRDAIFGAGTGCCCSIDLWEIAHLLMGDIALPLASALVVLAVGTVPGCKSGREERASRAGKSAKEEMSVPEMREHVRSVAARYREFEKKIRVGMSVRQVRDALGPPSSTEQDPGADGATMETWRYDIDTGVYYLVFIKDGEVSGHGGCRTGLRALQDRLSRATRGREG